MLSVPALSADGQILDLLPNIDARCQMVDSVDWFIAMRLCMVLSGDCDFLLKYRKGPLQGVPKWTWNTFAPVDIGQTAVAFYKVCRVQAGFGATCWMFRIMRSRHLGCTDLKSSEVN